jgi:hypothetical protein
MWKTPAGLDTDIPTAASVILRTARIAVQS